MFTWVVAGFSALSVVFGPEDRCTMAADRFADDVRRVWLMHNSVRPHPHLTLVVDNT